MDCALKPAQRPERIAIAGRYVTLTPPVAEHAEALYACTTTESLWDYMGDGPYATLEAFGSAWGKKVASADPLFYTLIDHRTNAPGGYLSLMRIEPNNACIEVGNIMYGTGLQRTAAATEAIYLAARYVFDTLGNRRFEWKCNALNRPSRRAALRYGFLYEGLFRQHMIIKGRNRDTAWYALLDSEWPARKQAFEAWLDPSNFDESGLQRKSLERPKTEC